MKRNIVQVSAIVTFEVNAKCVDFQILKLSQVGLPHCAFYSQRRYHNLEELAIL